MKAKALPILLLLICAASNFAGDGQLLLRNRHIIMPSGEAYHVPIWVDIDGDGAFDQGEGIGSYAAAFGQAATLGLYLRGENTPLATSRFRSDINGEVLGAPGAQDVSVPGYVAGQTAPLTIKIWIGDSYENATIKAAWDFMSPPLGGTPPDGGLPMIPPTLHTWGPHDGSGYAVQAPAGPAAGADIMTRSTISDARASITSLLANDSDASGAVVFVGVDAKSNLGGSVVVTDQGELVYTGGPATTDFFFYTVRNGAGGLSRGRVNVVINDPAGLIVFDTRNIPRADGNGVYSVPIYVDADANGAENIDEAFGTFAATYYNQKARLGLFLQGSDVPLAVIPFAVGSLGVYLEAPATQMPIVAVPGTTPGTPANLTIKAWIGDTFEASPIKGVWDLTTAPLGGTIANGASWALPGLTGWGPEAGHGIGLAPGAKPILGADEMAREYGRDGSITVETLLANDSDPNGGTLSFVDVDKISHEGATIDRLNSTIIYHNAKNVADYFFYTARSSRGVVAKGRVDVKVGDPVGEIRFSNRGMVKTSGDGTYDSPVWIDLDGNGVRDLREGIGDYASLIGQTARAGLYVQGQPEPIAVTTFSPLTVVPQGAFLSTPSEPTLVPGFKPGERAPLTIKVWVGNSFDRATTKGSWDFTSSPLGGPVSESEAILVPSLSGWGDENGVGYALPADPKVILPTITVPVVINQPIQIPFRVFLPGSWTTNAIQLADFTEGGFVIRTWQDHAVIDATLLQNDTFVYSVATPTGINVGQVALQVQESPAKIFLSNRLVRRSSGAGGYNVPVWVDVNFNGLRERGEGIGTFAAKQFGTNATLGLFLRDGTTPIATARFHRDAAGAFLEDPDFQEVTIPNVSPGTAAPLTLKAWVGNSFETATLKGSWDFTSKQLGGGAHTGIFETPDVTGWGDETNNFGCAIVPGAKPKTYGTVIARQRGQNMNAKIAEITRNDSDPDGGALTLVSVDESSKEGGVVSVLGDTFYYIAPIQDSGAPDYFEYTVRNSKGGAAKGRVDVVVTDANGQFNTRLAIEYAASGNEISFRGIIGSNYLVQFHDSIEAAWHDLGLAVHEGFGLFKISDRTAGATRFYRVVSQP
ncbi:MAG TPA: Ig-like domain-containing protein [Verrucomicrobiae bacterium]|nr:Ig-like domain-containing protein [Verrucomicrobiae bacterium]